MGKKKDPGQSHGARTFSQMYTSEDSAGIELAASFSFCSDLPLLFCLCAQVETAVVLATRDGRIYKFASDLLVAGRRGSFASENAGFPKTPFLWLAVFFFLPTCAWTRRGNR